MADSRKRGREADGIVVVGNRGHRALATASGRRELLRNPRQMEMAAVGLEKVKELSATVLLVSTVQRLPLVRRLSQRLGRSSGDLVNHDPAFGLVVGLPGRIGAVAHTGLPGGPGHKQADAYAVKEPQDLYGVGVRNGK